MILLDFLRSIRDFLFRPNYIYKKELQQLAKDLAEIEECLRRKNDKKRERDKKRRERDKKRREREANKRIEVGHSRRDLAGLDKMDNNCSNHMLECPICLTNRKDLAFSCGHLTCRECGSKVSNCPICRVRITSRLRIYTG